MSYGIEEVKDSLREIVTNFNLYWPSVNETDTQLYLSGSTTPSSVGVVEIIYGNETKTFRVRYLRDVEEEETASVLISETDLDTAIWLINAFLYKHLKRNIPSNVAGVVADSSSRIQDAFIRITRHELKELIHELDYMDYDWDVWTSNKKFNDEAFSFYIGIDDGWTRHFTLKAEGILHPDETLELTIKNDVNKINLGATHTVSTNGWVQDYKDGQLTELLQRLNIYKPDN